MEARNCIDDLDILLTSVVRATTNLRDENNSLKAENERLEKLLSEIMPEMKKLREERLALKAAVRVLMLQSGVLPPPKDKMPATFETLPYEIIETIFRFAAAEPTHQFDPSVQAGARNPWLQLMRWKIGLPLIHRAGFWPGMAALYGDIVLRRMGQVSALANTLRTADIRVGLGKLIKSIRWDSCIVSSPCADVIREDMAFIFSQCTQLQSFSYHPHRNFPLQRQPPGRDECEGFFNPMWFVAMPSTLFDPPLLQTSSISNLRSLDLSFGLNIDDDVSILISIHNILVTLKMLESLILGPWPSNSSFPEEIMGMPEVSLPCLMDLRIFGPGGAVETYICSRWSAPQLTRLTIFVSEWSPAQLLERFGSQLRYLHLYPNRDRAYKVLNYVGTLGATLSTVCPRLEHLIVPELRLLVNSPTLAHLDFWMSGYRFSSRQDKCQAKMYHLLTLDVRSSVPSLRTVRFIVTLPKSGLLDASCNSAVSNPDWPWICHPDLLAEDPDDVIYHRFPLGRVAQTVAALIPEDFWQMPLNRRDVFEASEDWQGVYGDLNEMLLDDEEFEAGGDWQGVYCDLEELQQKIEEAQREASEPRLAERETRDEETSSSDRSSDDSEEEEEEDGDVNLDEDDAAIEVNVDVVDGPKKMQDGLRGSMDLSEEREWSQEQEKDGQQGERDMKLERGQLVKASAELFESVPEYPVEQLDRAAILAAFRRGRGKETYD